MSNWKKLIVSGSDAHLSSVTASNGSVISGSLTMSGSINNVDHLNFYTTSSAATTTGRLVWNDGDGTLDLGLKGGTIALQLGQDSFARVYNAEATTLNKGEIVYISGSQGNRISVKRADNDIEAGSANTLGMVSENISSGAEGFVFTSGIVNGLNTVGLTAGATLYLSSSGQYTQTPPVAPKHTVIIGFVERIHATVGSIFVKVNNGYELGELHNVLTNGANYGDLLMYSASLWTHSKQLSGSYGLTGSLQATSFTGSLQGTATTASYVLNAVSSSFATNASTASYVLNAVSSSFATTASYVLGGGGGVSDGDKGDITVSSGGSTWTIDNDVVTYAKMQNITPGVLGRQSAGSGDITTLTALTDYHVLQWLAGAPIWSSVTTNNIQIFNNNSIIGKGTGLAAELSLGNGLAITGTTLFVTSSAFTGSLQGSASYALTASYAMNGGGASVTNPGNNYLITSDGTAGGLVGETNLNFDGTIFNVTGSAFISATTRLTDVEERELTVVIGGTPTSLSLDLSQANVFEVTYNNSVNSFSIVNPPATNYAGSFTLVITGTGVPYPWNWGSAVTWSGGSAPSVTSTNGKRDIYGFISTNQGTNWYGFIGAQNL